LGLKEILTFPKHLPTFNEIKQTQFLALSYDICIVTSFAPMSLQLER